MATSIESTTAETGGAVLKAGAHVKGEFRCTKCGYGVAIHDELPTCPMCRGEAWEPTAWRPFTRTAPPPGDPAEREPDAHLLA